MWAGHGHLNLYGDDGEMQCPTCQLDYKRTPLKVIRETLKELAIHRIAKAGGIEKIVEGGEK